MNDVEKNEKLQQMMTVVASVGMLTDHCETVKDTIFEEVTPELWEAVRGAQPYLLEVLDFVKKSMQVASVMIDDDELVKKSQTITTELGINRSKLE